MNYYKKRKNNGKGYTKTIWPESLRPELKFRDEHKPNTVLTQDWALYDPVQACLNGVEQGDDPTERDGRNYFLDRVMMHILLKSTIFTQTDDPIEDELVRIVLVLDTQTNLQALTPNDVFNIPGERYNNFRNLNFTSRFKVLKDETIVFRRNYVNDGTPSSFSQNATEKYIEWYHKFKTPLIVTCKGSGGGISSITNNSLHIMAVSSEGDCSIEYVSRVRFRG